MKIYIHTTPPQGRPKPLQKLRQLPFFLLLCSAASHSCQSLYPCGLALARTPIRTARHRSASRGTHCCDNCVRMLSSYLPHKPVKIRCFFDAESGPKLHQTLVQHRSGCWTHHQTDHAGQGVGYRGKAKHPTCRISLPATTAVQNTFQTH